MLGELAQLNQSGTSRTNISALPNAFRVIQSAADRETLNKALLLDAFLAEQFRAIHARPVDYKFTATVAEWTYETSAAVTYPSVQSFGGENLAIPAELFDKNFEVLWTWLLRVDRFHGYGIYSVTPLAFSSEFESNGRIMWRAANRLDDSVAPPMAAMAFTPRVDPRYVGWRV